MKVWPRTEELRKVLRHPTTGKFRFPEGPEDWPNDSFTFRLVRDGDLLTEDPAGKPVAKAKEK